MPNTKTSPANLPWIVVVDRVTIARVRDAEDAAAFVALRAGNAGAYPHVKHADTGVIAWIESNGTPGYGDGNAADSYDDAASLMLARVAIAEDRKAEASAREARLTTALGDRFRRDDIDRDALYASRAPRGWDKV